MARSKRKVSLRILTTFSTLVRFLTYSLLMKRLTSKRQSEDLQKRLKDALKALLLSYSHSS